MKRHLILFAVFGCLGITTEIFFTAITDLIEMFQSGNVNWKLQGKSYIWMFPIYGLAGIFFPILIKYFLKFHLILRMMIYATGILIVEFITGWLLDMLTGQCPWEYTSGWHVLGYIRLDYFPLWALFGWLIERVVVFFDKRIKL